MIWGAIKGTCKVLAAILTLAASCLFTAAFAAIGLSSFILMVPFIWGRPTQRRVSAGVDLLGAAFRFASTFSSVSPAQAMAVAKAGIQALPEDDLNGIAPEE